MSDALVAVLTPPGRSALATLGLRGPVAWATVRGLFVPRGKPLPAEPEVGRFWLGKFGEELADEAVLAVRPGGLEVHVHGGREVSRYLVELLVARGMRLCGWEEYLNDELAAALARTTTVRTAGVVLDQLQGALRRELARAEEALAAGDESVCRAILEALARTASLPLTRPARVAVAGAPNVGKSSLVNALAGYQRSVVAPTPGTTRDVTTTETAIDGWPVELVDTAGLRVGADELEAEGICLARQAIGGADVCLWLVDASAEPVWPEGEAANLRLVVNKCDLQPAWDLPRAGDALHVSGATGAGVAELLAALSGWLVPCPPPPGAAVVVGGRMAEEVAAWVAMLDEGRDAEVRGRLQWFLRADR